MHIWTQTHHTQSNNLKQDIHYNTPYPCDESGHIFLWSFWEPVKSPDTREPSKGNCFIGGTHNLLPQTQSNQPTCCCPRRVYLCEHNLGHFLGTHQCPYCGGHRKWVSWWCLQYELSRPFPCIWPTWYSISNPYRCNEQWPQTMIYRSHSIYLLQCIPSSEPEISNC